ncbi:septum site-determining protein MinC [Virgibacillus sp. W0430]|uniref:septum site-determining protein MinC n=1 Tax=Virgibacillus sp. W0430 TaxID=3391580 RepID=UPI003F44B76B
MLDNKKQKITIKGTRDGLTLFIDDRCSFEAAFQELKEKIKANRPSKDEPVVSVLVKLGNRYLHKEEKELLEQVIGMNNRLTIEGFDSDVILKEEALQWKEESEAKVINQIVRSGQVLRVKGDLILIGDVNPGGQVVATGNIYILGNLRGIAHAGENGDREAVIAASYMKPTQLRIADYVSRAPDYESEGVYMECGFINHEQDKIIIDRLQVLSQMRNKLSTFERRFLNG